MKNQVLNLIVSVLLGAVIASPMAFAGGVGDGGGNISKESPLYPEEIQKLIETSKLPLRYVFQRLEAIFNASETPLGTLEPLIRKLFRGPKTIFQALEEANYAPIPQGFCYDSKGEKKDASVRENSVDVCFALDPLSKRLKNPSGKVELLALAAHEVSHLVGTTEEEAEMLQTMIESSTATTVFATTEDVVNSYRRQLKEIAERLKFPKASRIDRTTTCSLISMSVSDIFKLNDQGAQLWSTVGIAPLGHQAMFDLFGAGLKGANISNFCFLKIPGATDIYADVFKNRSQISLNEFYVTAFKSEYKGHFGNRIIRRLHANDQTAVLTEINEMHEMLERTIASMK